MSVTKGGPTFQVGCFPTMITPFCDDGGGIDYPVVDALVEWYIESGCTGLFTVCLSSEMYHLTNQERILLSKRIKAAAKGRVPVVACGTFQGTLSEKANFIRALHPHCDAVVIITNQIVNKDESDDIFIERLAKLVNETPGVPLGFYECPEPYRRVLSPRIVQWAVKTGRFVFFKDTCGDLQLIDQKLLAIRQQFSQQPPHQPPLMLYNAIAETLLPSYVNSGAAGYSGISSNFFPWLHVFLIRAAHSASWSLSPELQKQAKLVQQFLTVAEIVLGDCYPYCCKYYLKQHYNQRFPTHTRIGNNTIKLNDIQKIHLADLFEMQNDLCNRLGIRSVPLVIKPASSAL